MQLWHMSGAGNDFIVLDARGVQLELAPLAKRLCAQYGTDGFMAVDHSQSADFRLHFYNSDGSRGEMCGNGSRCVSRFAYDHGIAGSEMAIETDAGIVKSWRLAQDRYRVRLNDPSIVDLGRKDGCAYVELGNPGVPHAVLEVPSLEHTDREALRSMAKALRYDPAFPKGANVNLYRWLDERTVRILTYERGVEDYTLACGTGSGSVAVVLWHRGQLPGGRLTLENPGGTLEVELNGKNGAIDDVFLSGPADVIKIYDL